MTTDQLIQMIIDRQQKYRNDIREIRRRLIDSSISKIDLDRYEFLSASEVALTRLLIDIDKAIDEESNP